MRGAVIVLAAVLALTACESDADKLRRLRTRAAILEVQVIAYEREYQAAQDRWDQTDFPVDSLTAWTDTIVGPYSTLKDSLDLVRRDINRLLQ